jgi:LDH2 family malate/lactate/ureidoglycolate dehydrogenase
MPTLPADQVVDLAREILERLGTPSDTAADVARWLVASDLAGHPSHGVVRVTDYAKRIASGDLVPEGRPFLAQGADGGSLVLVDGNAGYGHPAAELLVRTLVSRARENPIVTGGIVNASHTGRLGEWAEQAAAEGVILFICSASLARGNVAAYGAREARLGTNPLALAIPGADGDLTLLDFATSEISGGRIDNLIRAGERAPEGTMLDRDGEPTDDPRSFHEGGALLAFGGHKGYAISLAVALLAGCVVGEAAPGNARHGVFAFALDPGAFADAEAVGAAVAAVLGRMRSTPPRDGFARVEVPGDYERRNRAEQADGVRLDDAVWAKVTALAQELAAA